MTECTACKQLARLSPMLKCNRHRVQSMSAALVAKAQANGYTGTDPREAEQYLGARPIAAN